MAQEIGFAKEYSKLVTAALERGDKQRALDYNDKVRRLLERDGEPIEIELKLGVDHAQIAETVTA